MTLVTFDKKRQRLEVSGHANYAPPGHDIVCAGISTVTNMVILQIRGRGCKIDSRPAQIRITAPGRRNRAILQAAVAALRHIEAAHPTFLCVREAPAGGGVTTDRKRE